MAGNKPPFPAVPDGWTVEDVTRHYGVAGLFFVVFNVIGGLLSLELGSPSPTPVDVTYKVRHVAEAKVRLIKLPGDHAPNALYETLQLIRATDTT